MGCPDSYLHTDADADRDSYDNSNTNCDADADDYLYADDNAYVGYADTHLYANRDAYVHPYVQSSLADVCSRLQAYRSEPIRVDFSAGAEVEL